MYANQDPFILSFYVWYRTFFTCDLFFIWWLSNCRNDPHCVMGAFYQYIYFPSPPSLGMISRCSDCTVTVNAAYYTNNIGKTGYWEKWIVNDQKNHFILYSFLLRCQSSKGLIKLRRIFFFNTLSHHVAILIPSP